MSQVNRRFYEIPGAILGDARRASRLGRIVDGLSKHPAGKVSEVFRRPADRQAVYDFLEHETVRVEAVQEVAAREAALRCRGEESVHLVLDGSSLALTDTGEAKGFGSIGARSQGARGLKVLNALAVTATGRTVGVVAQRYWVRGDKPERGCRQLRDRESYRWHEAFNAGHAALQLHAPNTRVHVLADREGDASLLMQHIVAKGGDFTIRANGTRKVLIGGKRVLLLPQLRKLEPIASHQVRVRDQGPDSPGRVAELEVRAARVQMVMRDHHDHRRRLLELTVVWAREKKAPRGTRRLDWLLYTTLPLKTAEDAVKTIVRYSYRWRVEDFHKMLKSGGGCVEDSQLRSTAAVMKWATLHAMIASRSQRLRDIARTEPDAPASSELSDAEIEALVLLKTQEKRRNETISATGLTIGKAVRWIGDLGGFTATGASKKMPGATVIARGLERVLEAAQVIEALRSSGKMR